MSGHEENKGPVVLSAIWTVTAISTVFLVARLYVRGVMHGKFHSDDYYATGGQLCSFLATSLTTVAVSHGNGRHHDVLSDEQKQEVLRWTYAAFLPGIMAFCLPKFAVISLLTRLLQPSRWHKWFLWFLGLSLQLVMMINCAMLLFRCWPVHSLWDFSVEGKCFDIDILILYSMTVSAYSAFVDVYLAVYPAIVLYNLQMSLKKRIGSCVALSIGTVGGVVAIYKLSRIPAIGSEDFSYATADLVIWTLTEGSTIIIACSIPVLAPLLTLVVRHFKQGASETDESEPTQKKYGGNYSGRSSPEYELGVRKPKPKKRDDLGLTIMEGSDDLETGSESQDGLADRPPPTPPKDGGPVVGSRSFPNSGGITRTDCVTISYENFDTEKQTTAEVRWKPC